MAGCWAGFRRAILGQIKRDQRRFFRSDKLSRRNSRERVFPNRNGKWLAAYRIHSSGLRPVWPEDVRQLEVEYQLAQPSNGLLLALLSAPQSIPEGMLIEVAASITNTTEHDIPVAGCGLKIEPSHDEVSIFGSALASCVAPVIRPGETLPLRAELRLTSEAENNVKLHIRIGTWK